MVYKLLNQNVYLSEQPFQHFKFSFSYLVSWQDGNENMKETKKIKASYTDSSKNDNKTWDVIHMKHVVYEKAE